MKKIRFIPHFKPFEQREHVTLPSPQPASKYIPEWYSKSERYLGPVKKPWLRPDYSGNAGLKTCMPFLDSLTHGYIVETWVDIQVQRGENGETQLAWPHGPAPIVEREPELGRMIPTPKGHAKINFAWETQWATKTPRGYSILITHPLNRFDLPFVTLSGIVDSDYFSTSGKVPFYIDRDFEGIIPAGTPFMQIIPIKRESWSSEIGNEEDKKEVEQTMFDVARKIGGFYAKNSWVKKDFK